MLRSLVSILVLSSVVYSDLPHAVPLEEDLARSGFSLAVDRDCASCKIETKKTVCLNMIVKNESDVIERCLSSVKPVIDYWVIVDTGSDDNTKELILECLKDIPGELHDRPWRNFGENRTEAFQLAKGNGDYILFMDADDVLAFEGEAAFPPLTQDLYNMWRGSKGFSYIKPQLVKAALPWKWVGVTHEYLGCDQMYSSALVENVKYVTMDGGASAKDPREKFMKNVRLLEEGLKKEPHNDRYAFYLAESYRDAGEKGKALECYQKRIQMGGWEEEVFWSMFQTAQILRDLGLPASTVIDSYKHAIKYRPHRAEPTYYLAELYNQLGEHLKAYEAIKMLDYISKPKVKDSLFNMDWIESYGLMFQLSIAAYYVGSYDESVALCEQLMEMDDVPESWKSQAKINRSFPLKKLEAQKIALGEEAALK
jgi:glycosyltransferase involved in cell wall biosynthesis